MNIVISPFLCWNIIIYLKINLCVAIGIWSLGFMDAQYQIFIMFRAEVEDGELPSRTKWGEFISKSSGRRRWAMCWMAQRVLEEWWSVFNINLHILLEYNASASKTSETPAYYTSKKCQKQTKRLSSTTRSK